MAGSTPSRRPSTVATVVLVTGGLVALLLRRLRTMVEHKLAAQERALAETRAERDRCRRFLADATHQIRSPIAGIQAGAETLLRRSPSRNAEDQALLSEMLQETSRVGRLVEDLLQTARLDQAAHLQLGPCDVAAVCRHEVERAQRLAPTLLVSFDALMQDRPLPSLDAQALHDIVVNLLDNARRHARTRIAVSVRRADEAVVVRVADDGPGLSEEAAARVFERFVSLDGHGGSGLGLPIARELARAHGGHLAYEEGSFVVILPWASAAE